MGQTHARHFLGVSVCVQQNLQDWACLEEKTLMMQKNYIKT